MKKKCKICKKEYKPENIIDEDLFMLTGLCPKCFEDNIGEIKEIRNEIVQKK